MSADNWAICPRCKAKAEEASRKLKLKAGASYGKESPERYLELLEEAGKPVDLDTTLREDYNLGINSNGEFEIDYSASCQCGFKHRFNHKEKIK